MGTDLSILTRKRRWPRRNYGPGEETERITVPAGRSCYGACWSPRLQTSRAGRHIGQEAIQLHGGIGMTAEYIVGHMTARLTAIDHLLGGGREHTTRPAATLTDHGVVEPLG